MRQCLSSLFKRASRPFWGKGISNRLPIVGKIYSFAFSHLSPTDTILTEIQGLKIYAEARSSLAQNLNVSGCYEEGTTRLFHQLLREGMTVLDLGANVGYYSLLASSQVGETGKVFAFEPWHESFSLLQKNIEANGFHNIFPVAKAVSNKCGKQRLFLCNDPVGHSLDANAGKKYVEVDVTTVDEFVREQNICIDLIKMDVEGSEMDVLEGMTETINKNPGLKIITEFKPYHLKSNGCSPVVFLERLMSYGFKLCLLNEDKHTRQSITLHNMNDIIKLLQGRHPMLANIYCDRNAQPGIAA